jgi:cellulose synthase operon protein C
MGPSIVEKYEQILAADPRSRIFVELAKALLERGEGSRAIEVCQRGLEHHPSSILGRVIWGRALLEAGDTKAALDHFEIGIALDPGSPYAYNLVGEALVRRGLFREALPVLARAAELQPADARVQAWLDEAMRRVREAGGANGEQATPPASAPVVPQAPPDDDKTEPYRPISSAASVRPLRQSSGQASTGSGRTDLVAPAPARDPLSLDAGPAAPAAAPAAPSFSVPVLVRVPEARPLAAAPAHPAEDAVTVSVPLPARSASLSAPAGSASPSATTRPPPLKATPPPTTREVTNPRFVLSMLPGEARDDFDRVAPAAPPRPAAPVHDAAEASAIAARYEQELREKLLAEAPTAPGFLRRHRGALAAAAVLVALAGAVGTYLAVRAQNRAAEAASAAARARVGIARDTRASLEQAAEALVRAREDGSTPELTALAAQVNAILAAEHDDDAARKLARALAADPAAGEGALFARALLAETAADRKAAEQAVLAAGENASPIVQALAGRILLARGEADAGRARLLLAANAAPPLLRALAELGDAALASGDAEGALAYHAAALEKMPTHPRAAVGAAEARLALGRELPEARRALEAVEADAGSPPPIDLRERHELAFARILAATDAREAAIARLARAGERLGKRAALSAALAELHLATRDWDRAEAEAARAVSLAPKSAAHRVLLARARIGRGRFVAALEATNGADGRPIRIQRAIARLGLGQPAAAQRELQRIANDGKLPAEAAVWHGLADLAQGKVERARALLERLAAVKPPPPLAHVAFGRALAADGQPADAEQAFRIAIELEPDAPEGHAALGALLLAQGRAADAVPSLARAVQLDPADHGSRLRLGEARLAAGEAAAARAEFDAVLLARPRDAAALRLVSTAWLAEGNAAEARRAAEQATAAAPRDVAAWLAAAKAALAAGDKPAAKRFAARAAKVAPAKSAEAAEARALVARAR